MTDQDQRRERAKRDAEQRREQEKRKQYEREAMRRMDAPSWAVVIRMEQVEQE